MIQITYGQLYAILPNGCVNNGGKFVIFQRVILGCLVPLIAQIHIPEAISDRGMDEPINDPPDEKDQEGAEDLVNC